MVGILKNFASLHTLHGLSKKTMQINRSSADANYELTCLSFEFLYAAKNDKILKVMQVQRKFLGTRFKGNLLSEILSVFAFAVF